MINANLMCHDNTTIAAEQWQKPSYNAASLKFGKSTKRANYEKENCHHPNRPVFFSNCSKNGINTDQTINY